MILHLSGYDQSARRQRQTEGQQRGPDAPAIQGAEKAVDGKRVRASSTGHGNES
ncbi:hypothetical protein PAXRUDRAFT_822805 [Paxillus rubicundulus Ve08.2h10]|uniref:Uncharacterized protein n=1 Tax=Paxillus rubicundulus Ve08.2h10 TaxID=930991 RepID=A0A0D0DLD5_9AGAM|nr:hypothetical protein PAXRUDRAFT_822805 [Paxillus rubicundulus Ve08.2h10]